MPLTISDVPAFDRNDVAFDAVSETVFRSVHGTELWREQFSKFYAPADELLHDLAPLRVRGVVVMDGVQHVALVPRESPGQYLSP